MNDQGKPLPGVQIKIEEINVSAYTNEKGRFTLTAPIDARENMTLGAQSVLVSMIGYEPIRLKINIPNRKHQIKKPITLKTLEIKVPYRRKNLDLHKEK